MATARPRLITHRITASSVRTAALLPFSGLISRNWNENCASLRDHSRRKPAAHRSSIRLCGPPCGIVTLSLSFGMSPDQADTITIDPTMIDRIWRDFAFYRASGR